MQQPLHKKPNQNNNTHQSQSYPLLGFLSFAPSPNLPLPACPLSSSAPPGAPMRIRRRPPGQPLLYLLPSDPYPPLPASRDHPAPPPPGDKQQQQADLHPASATTNDSAADLGDDAARSSSSPLSRPALPPPQDGAVEQQRSRGGLLLGLGAQQQQQGTSPADARRSSLENGFHRHVPEPATNQAGELLSNNGIVATAVAVTTTASAKATKQQQQQQEKKDAGGGGGTKRPPRGPGTLLEGSRCSRKNGRGWRCSQPTLVGYALCQYHLGKGRMKSGSAATSGRGPGQLGRTEHANKKTSAAVASVVPAATAAAVVPATAAAPKADVPPPPTSVQH